MWLFAFDFSGVDNSDFLLWDIADIGGQLLDFIQELLSFDEFSEDDVLPIQPF